MKLDRRAALTGLAGAALSLAAPRLARAETASRRFTVLRGGDNIGEHTIRLTRVGGEVEAEIDISLVVRVLGIAAYRYEMTNRERWRDGRLVSLESRVNDDGTAKTVSVTREGEGLMVDGPNYSGAAPLLAATTTYYTPVFLERPEWISTDGGELYAVSREKRGAASVRTFAGEQVDATHWRVSDGGDYTVDLYYDDRGEWIGCGFDAGGEPARYRVHDRGARLAAVWAG